MDSKEFLKRRGVLFFSSEIFETKRTLKTMIKAFIWLQFIPIHVDYDFMCKKFMYLGYSPRFESVEEGHEIPTYKLISTEDSNKIKFSLEKVGYANFPVDISLNS